MQEHTPNLDLDLRLMGYDAAEITTEIAAHVVWHFDGTALEPGTFTKHLINTIATADSSNRAKLAKGFPGHVAAVYFAQSVDGGIEYLRAKVGA